MTTKKATTKAAPLPSRVAEAAATTNAKPASPAQAKPAPTPKPPPRFPNGPASVGSKRILPSHVAEAAQSKDVIAAVVPAEGTSIGDAVQRIDNAFALQGQLVETLTSRLCNAGLLRPIDIDLEVTTPKSDTAFGQALEERAAFVQHTNLRLNLLLDTLGV
jgi:hypothetical protein